MPPTGGEPHDLHPSSVPVVLFDMRFAWGIIVVREALIFGCTERRLMSGKLQLVEPAGQRGQWLIPVDRKLSIGRAKGNTARPNVRGLSRRHARVRFSAKRDSWVIRDLKSLNGTFINGKRVQGRAILRDGDLIAAGEALFRFSIR